MGLIIIYFERGNGFIPLPRKSTLKALQIKEKFMQKLKRNINMGFRVTEEEQKMIKRRMAQTHIRNLRAYLLKMAIDGRVLNLDLTHVQECSRLLRSVSNNVNQIAKRANEGSNVCADEITDVKTQLGEVWEQQDKIIKSLAKILEVV